MKQNEQNSVETLDFGESRDASHTFADHQDWQETSELEPPINETRLVANSATQTPKKRRRWFIAGAITLVLLIVAGFATELILRQVVPQRFAAQVREYLQLSPDHPVDTNLSGWLTPQLIAGSFQDISVSVSDVALVDGLRADLFGSAGSLPVNLQQTEIENAVIGARFSEEQLGEVVKLFSKGIGQDVTIDGNEITISHSLPVFGQQVPITVRLEPSVVDGKLHVDPISVDAAGIIELTADQLGSMPIFAEIADGLDICVSDKLPVGAVLSDLSLSSTRTLIVTVTLDPRIGIDPELQELGDCPE